MPMHGIVQGDRKLGPGHGHVVEVDFLTLRVDVQIPIQRVDKVVDQVNIVPLQSLATVFRSDDHVRFVLLHAHFAHLLQASAEVAVAAGQSAVGREAPVAIGWSRPNAAGHAVA